MKALFAIPLVIVLPLFFVACGPIPSSPGPQGKGDWQTANVRAKEREAQEER